LKNIQIKKRKTAHNRTVYASPPAGGSGFSRLASQKPRFMGGFANRGFACGLQGKKSPDRRFLEVLCTRRNKFARLFRRAPFPRLLRAHLGGMKPCGFLYSAAQTAYTAGTLCAVKSFYKIYVIDGAFIYSSTMVTFFPKGL
jgi:hypothetical protein